MNKNRGEKFFLWLLFLFALTLRLSYFIFLKDSYLFYGHPSDDVIYYQNWAKIIATTDGLGTSAFSGMPLFPYYLALLFRICLGHWFAVNILNLALGALNCVLLYILAKKLFSVRVALLTGLLAATNFILIYYDWLLMPVTLLISLSIFILLTLSDENPKSFKEWFLLGIFIGLATLGDGKFIIFGVLLIGYLFWLKRTDAISQILKIIFPLILGLIVILGGVTLRNKIVSGEWIFITSQSGLSLYVGNNPQANGAFENPEFIRPSHAGQDEDQKIFVEKTLKKRVSSAEVSKFYTRQAINFITSQPWEYFQLLGKKVVLLVSDSEKSHDIDLILQRKLKLKLDLNPYILIFPLAFWGMLIVWRTNREGRFIILLFGGYFIYSLIYFVTTRQRAPILPFLIIFEAYAFIWIAEKFRSRQYKALATPGLLFIIFILLFPPTLLDNKAYSFLNFSKIGSIYDTKKDYKKAAQAYHSALKIVPTDSNTLFNLGTAYLNQNDYQKAETCFLDAIKFGKFNIDASFNLGYIYEQTGQTQKALNAYQEVLKNTPESLDATFRIAGIYQAQGQCSQAKAHYDKLIGLKPNLAAEIQTTFKRCKTPINP